MTGLAHPNPARGSRPIQLEERVDDADDLYRTSGNVLLDRLLGATLHSFPVGEDEAAADAALERIARGSRVLFIHTGGLPGIFAYAAKLEPSLSNENG